MTLRNFLDLRKKVNPQIQIVEKIILQKRSWKTEVLRTFAVIITASAVIWGISNADVITPSKEAPKPQQIVGIYGTISNVTSSTFTLTKEIKPTENTNSVYTVTTTNIKKIETKDYASFSLSDLTEGDTVIVQGKDLGDTIDALHIIFFSHATTTPETATTTDATSTATTTDASSTDATSTASTSPSIIDTIKDVVSNAINTITGTTSTSTEEDATSTATSTDEATTSIQVATTVEATTSTSSNPSIIQTVTDAVTNTVNNVVSAINGTSSSTDTPTTPAQTPTLDPLPVPTTSDTSAPVTPPTN